MDFPPEVSVETETNPNTRTTWERDQHARVTFVCAAGPVEAWVDRQGILNLRVVSAGGMAIFPNGQGQVRVRPN